LKELDDNLHDSLVELHAEEQRSIEAYHAFMDASEETIKTADKRIVDNKAELEEVTGKIVAQERFRERRQGDLDVANADYEAETTRWDEETRIHEELMAELNNEMTALNECIDIFASPEMGGDTAKARTEALARFMGKINDRVYDTEKPLEEFHKETYELLMQLLDKYKSLVKQSKQVQKERENDSLGKDKAILKRDLTAAKASKEGARWHQDGWLSRTGCS